MPNVESEIEGRLLARQSEAEYKAREILAESPSPLVGILCNLAAVVVVLFGIVGDTSMPLVLKLALAFSVPAAVGLSIEVYHLRRKVGALVVLANGKATPD
jgi:hypothetical protein